nr:CoA transferase [Halomonas socia]
MQPLDDIRVIELGQLIAGPYCGRILADFGAELVKIEPPGKGDAMRQWGQRDADGNTLWWPIIARNKCSMTLDLRTAEMLDDPHFQARETIIERRDASGQPLPMQNVFPRLSRTPGEVKHCGPRLGEHTQQILEGWLDHPPARIDGLRQRGII